jgi:hypothetical protein
LRRSLLPAVEQELRGALNNWRNDVLAWLGRESIQSSHKLEAARDGLAIAHRNPGEVASDVIDILWESMNEAACKLERLDHIVQRIEEMELPELIVLFQRTTKLETYPWEGSRWQLPSIF